MEISGARPLRLFENGPAASLLVGHLSIQIGSLLPLACIGHKSLRICDQCRLALSTAHALAVPIRNLVSGNADGEPKACGTITCNYIAEIVCSEVNAAESDGDNKGNRHEDKTHSESSVSNR